MITHYINDSSNTEWRRALIDVENDYENAEIIVPLSQTRTLASAISEGRLWELALHSSED